MNRINVPGLADFVPIFAIVLAVDVAAFAVPLRANRVGRFADA